MNQIRLHQLLRAFLLCIICAMCANQGGAGEVESYRAKDVSDFSIEDYRGKVLYLDFWASWCGPCREAFPFMAELSERYSDDLVVVAVNLDQKREFADAFLADFKVPFEIVFDPDSSLMLDYDIPGMPTSYLFARDGSMLARHIGFRRDDKVKLENAIAKAVRGQ